MQLSLNFLKLNSKMLNLIYLRTEILLKTAMLTRQKRFVNAEKCRDINIQK